MHIVLKPMPQSPGSVCVGTADGEPLSYRGRDLHVGDRLVSMAEIGEDLVDAVDRAATRVLGSEWVTSLARLAQVNRRTTSKDRIAKFGLPDYVLLLLGHAAAHEHPRALGHALLCVEALQSDSVTGSDESGRPTVVDTAERNMAATKTLRRALSLLDDVLFEREAFRARKQASDAAFEWKDGDRPVTKD